jgi:actin-like ATPase involved in cell morphogenesis
VLGVDLGTTFTAAAIQRGDKPEIVQLGGRSSSIPSVIWLGEDGQLLVGEPAERHSLTDPNRVVREFKRRVGDPVPLLVGGAPYSAETLMSRLLRWVVESVSRSEGAKPERVAVTYPANWGPYKRELLDQALSMAELTGVVILTEPVAAASYYASTEKLEVGGLIAAYDLGGGTFDSAILQRRDGGFELLGTPEGIERLGGIDFDEAIFEHLLQMAGDPLGELDHSDPGVLAAVAHLRQEAVAAKEGLSVETDVSVPILLPNRNTQVRLTRAEFEEMVRPRLADTVAALRRSLKSAGLEPPALRAVLLVGGSSRIPLVAQAISAALGRPVAVDAHPKNAVALGAALAAANGSAQAFATAGSVAIGVAGTAAAMGMTDVVEPSIKATSSTSAAGAAPETETETETAAIAGARQVSGNGRGLTATLITSQGEVAEAPPIAPVAGSSRLRIQAVVPAVAAAILIGIGISLFVIRHTSQHHLTSTAASNRSASHPSTPTNSSLQETSTSTSSRGLRPSVSGQVPGPVGTTSTVPGTQGGGGSNGSPLPGPTTLQDGSASYLIPMSGTNASFQPASSPSSPPSFCSGASPPCGGSNLGNFGQLLWFPYGDPRDYSQDNYNPPNMDVYYWVTGSDGDGNCRGKGPGWCRGLSTADPSPNAVVPQQSALPTGVTVDLGNGHQDLVIVYHIADGQNSTAADVVEGALPATVAHLPNTPGAKLLTSSGNLFIYTPENGGTDYIRSIITWDGTLYQFEAKPLQRVPAANMPLSGWL